MLQESSSLLGSGRDGRPRMDTFGAAVSQAEHCRCSHVADRVLQAMGTVTAVPCPGPADISKVVAGTFQQAT